MILNQFGLPAKAPQSAAQAAAQGYKRTYADGFGKSEYVSYDKVTGILRKITFNGDGTFTTKQWQDVQAIADANKLYNEAFKKNPKNGYQRQISLPQSIHYDFMKQSGWKPGKGSDYDKKKFDALINDPDYAVFKSRPGRVSVQNKMWV